MSETLVKVLATATDLGLLDGDKTHDPSVPVSTLGMDSLEFMELIVAVEDEFNVDLFHSEFPMDPTINDFVAEIEARMK